jgi:hypothetical protein
MYNSYFVPILKPNKTLSISPQVPDGDTVDIVVQVFPADLRNGFDIDGVHDKQSVNRQRRNLKGWGQNDGMARDYRRVRRSGNWQTVVPFWAVWQELGNRPERQLR